MKIFIADKAGFCFGVKRAVKQGEKNLKNYGVPLASWGPLIHNPQEIRRLEKEGIIPREDFNNIKEKMLLIRAHGVPPEIYKRAKEYDLEIVDCTCPFVTKVQRIAYEYANKGYTILILGDDKHPEVRGIAGWSMGKGVIFNNIKQLKNLEIDYNNKICFVSQTTQNQSKFKEIEEYLQNKTKNLVSFNTICSATRQRQEAAQNLAKKVDLMIVVGGLNSANTRKLTQLCCETGTITKHIETAKDLKSSWFYGINGVGITAGASTPDWIIEEVVNQMEELKNVNEEQVESPESNQESNFEEQVTDIKNFKPGSIITGTVVQINNDEVLVDIGGKSEGVIPLNELAYTKVNDANDFVSVGDSISVLVLRGETEDGNIRLSKRRADQIVAVEKLQKAFDNDEIIEAEVTEVVKGGLLVDVGVRGFMPASLLERGYVEDLQQYVGQKLRMKIIEFDPEAKKAVLSRKVILDEEYEILKEKTLNELEKGQTRKGIVRRITNFGAFVDLGGVDGLLHVSEMGLGRVENPKDVVSEGEEIEVYILNVDKEKEKISLSLKALLPDPWDSALKKYPEGSTIKGKVVRIAPFGAFVEVEPGLDGLVHISQLAWERVAKPDDVVKVGQEVEAKVLDLDIENKRMSLSIKEAVSKPKQEKKEEVSQVIKDDEPSGCTIGDAVGNILKDYNGK